MALPLLLAAVALSATAAPHPNSLSSSSVLLDGERASVGLRLQALSLLEVLALDADEDGRLTDEELAAGRDDAARYLADHYRLAADRGAGEEPVPLELVELAVAPDSVGLGLERQWLEASLTATWPGLPGAVVVEVSLFDATSPDHRDFARLRAGELERDWMFQRASPRWRVTLAAPAAGLASAEVTPPAPAPGERAPRTVWLRLGVEHILGGYDHLAFVLGLVLAASGAAALAGSITAFTLAHSLTLGLAALGVVAPGGPWIERGIALSVAWVGFANLAGGTPRCAWPEAFLFGLVHGLGFAGLLRDALAAVPDAGRALPLLGFNLGVELGQLAAGGLVVLALFLARRRVSGDAPGLAPRPVARAGSALVVAAGLAWLVARIVE